MVPSKERSLLEVETLFQEKLSLQRKIWWFNRRVSYPELNLSRNPGEIFLSCDSVSHFSLEKVHPVSERIFNKFWLFRGFVPFYIISSKRSRVAVKNTWFKQDNPTTLKNRCKTDVTCIVLFKMSSSVASFSHFLVGIVQTSDLPKVTLWFAKTTVHQLFNK